jgi:type III restriction enzyme
VLVLCPSNTIESGLMEKFRALAGNADLRDLLPKVAKITTPKIINASETIVDGSICVENYHAILEHVKSSIRDSLKGKGSRVAVLNDEAHHVANESQANAKRWKEFLLNPEYGFRYVVACPAPAMWATIILRMWLLGTHCERRSSNDLSNQ